MYKAAGQKNLTLEGQAHQSTDFKNYIADRALTPPASTDWSSGCSHTGEGHKRTAWWSLHFAEPLFISTVILYYRDTFATRVNGFSLYVTNSTIVNIPTGGPVGFLCYKDPETLENQQFIFNIDCNTVGRKVVFYNTDPNEAFVELCYVEVHGCPLTKYGTNCAHSCPSKCINQHCFPGNGSCVLGCGSGFCLDNSCSDDETSTIGCTNGRNGKYCDKSYKNLALNKTAVQGQPYQVIPSSVDGNRLPTSCAKFTESNSWIEVDIGFYGIIKAVYLNIIDTISSGEKMFSVYCTNVSNSNEILLYNGQLPSNDIAVEKTICRYVRILPSHSTLQICEIEVIGCQSRWYGKYCNMSCPEHCGGPCDLDTGDCIHGCTDGYTGTECDKECENGKYGSQCLQTCAENCNFPPCDHVTGKCVNGGCKPGWIGNNCITACSLGTYGINCSELCIECVGDLCDNVDGICYNKSACKPGWKFGPKCNDTCNDTHYGVNCMNRCYCLGDSCNKTTGFCQAGCEKGWEGKSCSKECNANYFGENCNHKCDGCIDDRCDRWEGICANGTQCKPGWEYNEKCNNKCTNGTYGRNCSESCNGCVDDLCDHVDGFCSIIQTCKPGWKTLPKCDEIGVMTEVSDSSASIGAGVGVSLFVLIIILLSTMIYVRQRNSRNGICRGTEHTSEYENTPKSSYYTDLQNMNIDDRQETGYINTGTSEHAYDGLQPQSKNGIETKPEDTTNNKQNDTNVYESIANNKTNADMVIYQNEIL